MSGFEPRPARRENVPLLIGYAGGTGSGKTMSALLTAKGLAGGARFVVIDTENGRSKFYADDFEFDHVALDAPFSPDRYAEALHAVENYPVIVIDSASHEHAGDGGILDMHEEELQRMAGDDYKRREAMTWAAWVKPKQAHKKFVGSLLRVRAHVILCFRAEEKIEIVREGGKVKVVPKKVATGADGWVPVAEKTFPYELTASMLLTPDAPGVPKEIKIPEPLKPMIPLDAKVSAEVGVKLGAWARGPGGGTASGRAPELELATEADRRGIFEWATACGVPPARVKAIMAEVAGVEESALIRREFVQAILDRIKAEEVPV